MNEQVNPDKDSGGSSNDLKVTDVQSPDLPGGSLPINEQSPSSVRSEVDLAERRIIQAAGDKASIEPSKADSEEKSK